MRVLLDTNAFLWWVTDDEKLSAKARSIISNSENIIFFSVASAWEIVIKYQLGKLPLPEPAKSYIPSRLEHYGFVLITIGMQEVLEISNLENHHKDPFDRILIAQGRTKNLPIITADQKFALYDADTIW
jgi:PIN domain nuclease of toxin-antitoxin system